MTAALGLGAPMLTAPQGWPVEGEGTPAAGRLGVGLVHLVIHATRGRRGVSRARAKSMSLHRSPRVGPAHAGCGHENPDRIQPVVAYVSEEGAQLLRAPDLPLGRCAVGGADVIGLLWGT